MLRGGRIKEGCATHSVLVGDQIEKWRFAEEKNGRVLTRGREPAIGPLLPRITKASLSLHR